MEQRHKLLQILLLLTMGVYAGLLLVMSINFEVHLKKDCTRQSPLQEIMSLKSSLHFKEDLIFLGIMTAPKYLRSRVVEAYSTWVQKIPGRVQFFYTEGDTDYSVYHPINIPVVALPGAEDELPNSQKGFLLLKYMHDNFGDKYEWFMKIFDDSKIDGNHLLSFLRSRKKSSEQFFGYVKEKVDGADTFSWKDNFCIGSPGIIFNRAFLKAITPYINHCLETVPVLFEEVTIGKCLYSAIAANCNQSLETIKGYIQLPSDEPLFQGSYKSRPKEEISLHSTQILDFDFWRQKTMIENKLRLGRNKITRLKRDVKMMTHLLGPTRYEICHQCMPSLQKFKPNKKQEVLDWSFLNSDVLFSKSYENPVIGLMQSQKGKLKEIENKLEMLLNYKASEKGRILSIESFSYGYQRISPLHGVDFVFDFNMIFKKTVGEYLEVPVRRHIVAQQQFNDLEFKEVLYNDITKNVQSIHSPKFHFILPLMGKYSTFLIFMAAFEQCCLKDENKIILIIVTGSHESMERLHDVITDIHKMKSKYANYHEFLIIQTNSNFVSRTQAFMLGHASLPQDSLLILIDTRLRLKSGILETLKSNTIYGQQVYIPIPFSPYYHSVVDQNFMQADEQKFKFDDSQGFWDMAFLSAMSVYKKDVDNALNSSSSSIDLSIEDMIPLFAKVKISIFQTADLDFEISEVDAECNSFLCLNIEDLRKAGSQKMLADYVFLHRDILERF